MIKINPKRLFYSRLAKREEQRNFRRAFLFGVLTLGLILAVVLFGTSFLIKLSVFFADLKQKEAPAVEQGSNLPLLPPRLNDLPEYTKNQTLTLSGFAKPGVTVEIFINNFSQGTTVATQEGAFAFENINLSLGKNEVYALASDRSGNKSQTSEKTNVVFKNTPPKLDISEPKDGDTYVGEKKRKIKIIGQSEEGINLLVNDHLVILDQESRFNTEIYLNDGENTIKIVATDQAGNQTEKAIKVNFRP